MALISETLFWQLMPTGLRRKGEKFIKRSVENEETKTHQLHPGSPAGIRLHRRPSVPGSRFTHFCKGRVYPKTGGEKTDISFDPRQTGFPKRQNGDTTIAAMEREKILKTYFRKKYLIRHCRL